MKMTNAWNRFIYRLWAPVYDSTVGRLFLPGRRRALHLLDLRSGERLLLCGVGTGEDIRLLPLYCRAVGVDLSPHMLARAQQKLKDCSRQVVLIRGDAQCLPLAAQGFDAVLLSLILSVVPDGRLCLDSALRVLKPGGRLVVFDKFLSGERASLVRRLMNFFSTLFGTDINRSLAGLLEGMPCHIILDEPSLGRGMYHVVVLEKDGAEATMFAEPISLQGVSETLLIPLFVRALEAARPDAILRDENAAAILRRLAYDFSKIKLHEHDKVTILMREREFDRFAREFLSRHPCSTVVHIGCGLDTRFQRVDNGCVEWYDLDLPPVIDLRRQVLPMSLPRYHLISSSVFEPGWLEQFVGDDSAAVLILAEAVFPYCQETDIKALVRALRNRLPGSELVFDALSPFFVKADNLQLAASRIRARMHWGLKNPRDLEAWAPGICLAEAWYYFDKPEPRLRSLSWMRYLPFLARAVGIFRYRLGMETDS